MTALRNPTTGSIIQASGGLETRLLEQGWMPTTDPPAQGLRIITAVELETAIAAVQARIDSLNVPEVAKGKRG